jgi:hypothetical protein
MQSAYIVTGTMTSDRTVALDEDVELGSTKVRLVIEPLSTPGPRSAQDVLATIWAAQDAQGYVPRSREQVDSDLAAERASWRD